LNIYKIIITFVALFTFKTFSAETQTNEVEKLESKQIKLIAKLIKKKKTV